MESVKFDFSKLSGRIREICTTREAFAKKMNMSEASVSNKLRGKKPFSQPEISRAARILEIPEDEILIYFFKYKV